mmetsp:Transcript_11695/g.27397  ORF Transcript_11695/g.27397 Transcript_11695/m.27397 type:complete len:143 (+) Transcript_11695:194-622(+)
MMIQSRNFKMRTVTSVAKRCVLFLLVVAIAATNGRDGDASSSLFASAAKCRDKKAKIIFGETKRNYCKWVGEDADVRCLDKKTQKEAKSKSRINSRRQEKEAPKVSEAPQKVQVHLQEVRRNQTDRRRWLPSRHRTTILVGL